jgi:hypothetical protein
MAQSKEAGRYGKGPRRSGPENALAPKQSISDTPKQDIVPYERSSPSLLAQQPADISLEHPATDSEWVDLKFHLESRLLMMTNWRLSWWRHWALLAENILPRRYHWLVTPNTMTRGFPINQNIVDPTGSQAMRVCASGLKEGLTSPSRPWFKIKAAQPGFLPDKEAQIWFDNVEGLMYSVMARSNFYDSLTQVFEDLTVFGTSPMIIYEDEKDVIRCHVPCAGEYYLASSNSNRVESFYRKFVMTVSQIVQMFGLDKCPGDIQGLWKTKGASLDVERIVAHAIEPNFPIIDGRGQELKPMAGSQFPYREVYWVWGASSEYALSVRGFYEEPFISPRWAITSNDPYGRSPGMDTLPDIMQLQLESKRKAEAIEKHVRPPLLASVELQNQPSSALPGHVTYVANLGPQSGMRPVYEVNPQLQWMVEDIKQIQERIKKGFFNDIFMLHSDTTKEQTAYETSKRDQEKMTVLGPVVDRFQNEGASPAIKRIFGIMRRRGMLPPIPDSLKGVGFDIEYISMLAMAQKAAATTSIERVLATAGNLMAADPEIMDNFDLDETIREYGDLMSAPHKIFKDRKAMEEKREQRRQAQAQQAHAQATAQIGTQAAQTAKVMSDTPVGGGGSALDHMLGMGGGQPIDMSM